MNYFSLSLCCMLIGSTLGHPNEPPSLTGSEPDSSRNQCFFEVAKELAKIPLDESVEKLVERSRELGLTHEDFIRALDDDDKPLDDRCELSLEEIGFPEGCDEVLNQFKRLEQTVECFDEESISTEHDYTEISKLAGAADAVLAKWACSYAEPWNLRPAEPENRPDPPTQTVESSEAKEIEMSESEEDGMSEPEKEEKCIHETAKSIAKIELGSSLEELVKRSRGCKIKYYNYWFLAYLPIDAECSRALLEVDSEEDCNRLFEEVGSLYSAPGCIKKYIKGHFRVNVELSTIDRVGDVLLAHEICGYIYRETHNVPHKSPRPYDYSQEQKDCFAEAAKVLDEVELDGPVKELVKRSRECDLTHVDFLITDKIPLESKCELSLKEVGLPDGCESITEAFGKVYKQVKCLHKLPFAQAYSYFEYLRTERAADVVLAGFVCSHARKHGYLKRPTPVKKPSPPEQADTMSDSEKEEKCIHETANSIAKIELGSSLEELVKRSRGCKIKYYNYWFLAYLPIDAECSRALLEVDSQEDCNRLIEEVRSLYSGPGCVKKYIKGHFHANVELSTMGRVGDVVLAHEICGYVYRERQKVPHRSARPYDYSQEQKDCFAEAAELLAETELDGPVKELVKRSRECDLTHVDFLITDVIPLELRCELSLREVGLPDGCESITEPFSKVYKQVKCLHKLPFAQTYSYFEYSQTGRAADVILAGFVCSHAKVHGYVRRPTPVKKPSPPEQVDTVSESEDDEMSESEEDKDSKSRKRCISETVSFLGKADIDAEVGELIERSRKFGLTFVDFMAPEYIPLDDKYVGALREFGHPQGCDAIFGHFQEMVEKVKCFREEKLGMLDGYKAISDEEEAEDAVLAAWICSYTSEWAGKSRDESAKPNELRKLNQKNKACVSKLAVFLDELTLKDSLEKAVELTRDFKITMADFDAVSYRPLDLQYSRALLNVHSNEDCRDLVDQFDGILDVVTCFEQDIQGRFKAFALLSTMGKAGDSLMAVSVCEYIEEHGDDIKSESKKSRKDCVDEAAKFLTEEPVDASVGKLVDKSHEFGLTFVDFMAAKYVPLNETYDSALKEIGYQESCGAVLNRFKDMAETVKCVETELTDIEYDYNVVSAEEGAGDVVLAGWTCSYASKWTEAGRDESIKPFDASNSNQNKGDCIRKTATFFSTVVLPDSIQEAVEITRELNITYVDFRLVDKRPLDPYVSRALAELASEKACEDLAEQLDKVLKYLKCFKEDILGDFMAYAELSSMKEARDTVQALAICDFAWSDDEDEED